MSRVDEPTRETRKSLSETVNDYLSSEIGERNLIICGHSLGGALATLLAHELHECYNRNIKAIFTFGQPAVGLKSFADAYCFHEITYRMCAGIDIVTFLPGPLYRHVGESIWFHNDDFYLDIKWYRRIYRTIVDAFMSLFKDHSMNKYIKKGQYF